MNLKAYMVYNRYRGSGESCFLVYAHSSGQARYHISRSRWGYGFDEYVDLAAKRMPDFDQYAEGEDPYCIETNEELPEGIRFYYDSKDNS